MRAGTGKARNTMIDTKSAPARMSTRTLLLVMTIICIVTPRLAAEPLHDFSQALRNRGVSQDEVTAITEAFDEETWDTVPPETDIDALALSLAYALEQGIATREEADIVTVTQSAAAEIARMHTLGFSRQEAARAGVQRTRRTVAELQRAADQPQPGDEQPEAGRTEELPPAATDAMRRGINRARRNSLDIRSRIPGITPRNPPPTPFSPDGETPDTDDRQEPSSPGTGTLDGQE